MRWPSARRVSVVLLALGVLVPALALGGTALVSPPLDKGSVGQPVVVGVQGPADRGQVVYYNASGDVAWRHATGASVHAVEALPNGSVLAAYAEGEAEDCGPYAPPCGRTGIRLIQPVRRSTAGTSSLDDLPVTGTEPEPRVVAEWSFSVRTMGNSEIHDVEVLPTGEVLIADMDRERVFVLDGLGRAAEVVWQWNASQRYAPPPAPTRADWLHINDVDRLDEGRYLVSVRNANQLVVVNRSCTCVTEVVNADLAPPDGHLRGDKRTLRGQHNPQWLGPNRVLVADSSNDRLVELTRTDEGEPWEVAWTQGAAGGIEYAWPRDADRLPDGRTLVTDSRNNRVVLLDADGDLVASYRTPPLPYEADFVGVDEPVSGPAAGSPDDGTPGDGEGYMPFFSEFIVGLHHSVGLPYWFTWVHGLLAVLGFAYVNAGLAFRWLQSGGRGWTRRITRLLAVRYRALREVYWLWVDHYSRLEGEPLSAHVGETKRLAWLLVDVLLRPSEVSER